MRKIILICVMTAFAMTSAGCFGGHELRQTQMEVPREQFDPEEAFLEIPHNKFEAVWLDGSMKAEGSDLKVYEEAYEFKLSMEKAVIPYTVTGKLIQICEYDISADSWNVEYSMEDVIQEMDLSTYQWALEDPVIDYIETFVKTGPNTFATGEPDQPTEPYFTVDILSGGVDLKDRQGDTILPGGQWTARLYIEYPSYSDLRGEAAIDLIGGYYGYEENRWIVPISELKRVEKEKNMTEEERAREKQECFVKTFPSAASLEEMDPALAKECSRELAFAGFGDVGIELASEAKDISGEIMGWVVQAYSKDAYNGKLVISVAIQRGGVINGLEFLMLEDTPGLGLRAAEDEFKNQFIGKHSKLLSVTTSENAGESEINAISGATTTSNAVTNAVNAVLYYVENFTGAT